MATVIPTTFKLKRGIAARWAEVNPVLAQGEPGFVYDTNKLKIGDGITPWNSLPYIEGSTGIETFNTYADLPSVGNELTLYRVITDKALYQYNVITNSYDVITSTDNIISLTPVDGSLIINNNTIDIGISADPGNALVKKQDGLYVGTGTSGNYAAGLGLTLVDGTFAVKIADVSHGLSAVNGALTLNLATKLMDGAMSKEDKVFLDELKELNISNEYATKDEMQEVKSVLAQIEDVYRWSDM